ncbi:MAG TPA: cytochrome c [Stellaceae bacterium]|nr:cytochrome c [Stellaceae bacterium]
MRRLRPPAAALAAGLAACLSTALALAIGPSVAQPYQAPAPGQSAARSGENYTAPGPAAGPSLNAASPSQENKTMQKYMSNTEALLKTPVSGLHPGGINVAPQITNPAIGNPIAVQRGMQYFAAFNCVGCHAANGGGGMGRALSNRFFLYGASPANIYITIAQGRPNGMPAWGSMLPPDVIWDLVAYIEQISKAPVKEWGETIAAGSPSIQQVPAEFKKTDEPWSYVEPFSKGQKPTGPYPPGE